ncbi:hypothetical protein AB7M17_006724 [Bradyrhizobium sp. USDA 377]
MKYRAPLDPDCPDVAAFMAALFGDPMTRAMGARIDDITEAFARTHRATCKRCQDYGAANLEIE